MRRDLARDHSGRRHAAPAGAGAGRLDPDPVGAQPAHRQHGPAAGRPAGDRRGAPRPGDDLQQDHRRLSRRDAARPDRNAVPRRRARARRHLRDDDRMPAGRGADRAGLSGADARLCAGRSRSRRRADTRRRLRRERSSPTAWTRRSWSATSSRTGTSTASAGRPSPSPSTSRTRIHIRDEFIKSGVRSEHIDGCDAEARARCHAGAARIRRDRGGHQLHGADRGLGHARGRLLHPGAADQARWASTGR